MSQRGKTKICFLILLCAVGLSEAFNSAQRSSNGDAHDSAQVQHAEPDEPTENNFKSDNKHPLISPARPEVPRHKIFRRVRRAKQRHSRNSRDWQTEAEMNKVFSAPSYQNQQVPAASARSELYSQPQYGYNPYPYGYVQPQLPQQPVAPYGYAQPQLPQQPAGYPYFAPAPVSHNTIVPNGPQINNYYHQVSPQQYPGYQNNYPAPFVSGQFLYIPIPFCYPYFQQQGPAPVPPKTNQDDLEPINMNVTLQDRLRPVEDENTPLQVNPGDYYNTATGISLQPVRPLRPNSVQPPPAQHNYDNDDDQDVPDIPGNSLSQPNRPQPRPTQRPRTPTTRPPRPPSQGLDVPDSSEDPASNCVLAIIRCCSASGRRDLANCFERRGCPGVFFDGNPCESQFGRTLSNAASEIQKNGLIFT